MADITVERYRDRKHCLLLYPDNPIHAAAIARLKTSEFRAVGCMHDQDQWTEEEVKENPEHKVGDLKKPHWHFVLKYKNAVWNTAIADDLGIEARWIVQCRDANYSIMYLIHYNAPEKYQYEVDMCVGTLVPELKKLIADETEDCRVLRVLELIDKCGYLTMSDFIRMVCNAGLYSDVRRAGFLMSKILEEHNNRVRPADIDPETGEVLE